MIAFETVPGDDAPPWEEPHELQRFYDQDRADVAACAARLGGHRWQVIGEPDDEPFLVCEDCPADADDVFEGALDELAGSNEDGIPIGDQVVVFGQELPADAEPFTLPVSIEVTTSRYDTCEGTEYDVEITITPREASA